MNVVVKLWGTKIGILRYNELTKTSSFQYDNEFIKFGIEVSPIVMPLSKKTYSFGNRIASNFGLPPMLRDSLPDTYGNEMINVYLSSLGREENSLTPSERLCYIGKRGIGALEYQPELVNESENKAIDINRLVRLANSVLVEREKFKTKDIDDLINISTSAGGARAKAIVQYNSKTGEFRSGQKYNKDFIFAIIKFDDFNKNNYYTRIEFTYYLIAKAAGINMMSSFLIKRNNKYHFLTQRFDRIIKNRKINKLHQQTLSAMANLDYNEPNVASYENAASILDKIGASNDKKELYRRMIFNIIMRNQDDHPKNITFLMNKKGLWSLSPAYDLTYACDRNNRWLKAHQMNINNKSDNITLKDVYEVAKHFHIKKEEAEKIIRKVESASYQFSNIAKEIGIDKKVIKKIESSFNHLI